jgi:hypothetical protein
MAKPTAKIQITIETLQRTIIRKRNFHKTAETGVFQLLLLKDDIASAHLPAKVARRTENKDSDNLDKETEK